MKISYTRLVELAEAAGLDVYPNGYSGRGMYGAKCFGVTAKNTHAVLPAILQAALDQYSDADEISALINTLKSPSADSMGLKGIVYWPSVSP
jgi:hypothetical protein